MIAGVTPLNGNMKPVMLVSSVVQRNTCVTFASHAPRANATKAMMPAAMPTRLMKTCRVVNAESDRPSVMARVLPFLLWDHCTARARGLRDVEALRRRTGQCGFQN